MNTKQVLYVIGGITVAYVGLRWVASYLNVAGAGTANVTSSNKGGTVTTPIKTSQVAFAAPMSTISLLLNKFGTLASQVTGTGSKQNPVPANSRTTPYGNENSAKAAASSPVKVDYTVSAYAILKPRY